MSQLVQRLVGSNTLPSPPGIALEIMRLNEDEEVSISDLAGVISKDPAIAAKLLRMANSSQIGRPGQVSDIGDAVMTLGIRSANLLTLSFSLASCSYESRSNAFDYTRFWTASACNAVVARLIARSHLRARQDEAFLAGLLCDFAQLMLAESAPREYEPVLRWNRANGGPIQAAELAQLGCDHAEFGRLILLNWGLPPVICEAVGAHHKPTWVEEVDQEAQSLARVLHLASICSHLYIEGAEEQADELVALGATYFEMDASQCQELLDEMREGVSEFLEILDLSAVDPTKLDEIRTQANEILLQESLELNQRVQSISGTLERLSQQNLELERSARTDPLTGLKNRVFLEEALKTGLDWAVKDGGSVGLLIIDVDRFKEINDIHGHLAGDTVLKEIAAVIETRLNLDQSAVRCGGDEFIVLCTNVSPGELIERAQRLRLAVEEMTVTWDSKALRLTISAGGCVAKGSAAAHARTALLKSADDELYRAKAKGRNRVFVTTLKERRT